MRWRVWYQTTESGETFRALRTYRTQAQALAAGKLHVMMRQVGMFRGIPLQFQVRRSWHRRAAKGKWLP